MIIHVQGIIFAAPSFRYCQLFFNWPPFYLYVDTDKKGSKITFYILLLIFEKLVNMKFVTV